ncbi:hypothetical protein M3612_20235 [Niallia taxi]|uniref:hypothetical protein n=1 Tax=Niallia taxi TaxID=2499688 RepID=UPI00203C586A|nr:hypothetical protein [Niallia taxi]MCM3216819.1 hypothetical protein [Niallia taxi]
MGKIARDLSDYSVLRNLHVGNNDEEVKNDMLKEFDKADKYFPDGIFVDPKETNEPKIRFRALSKYCAEHGKKPKDLTDEEREHFIIRD